MQWKKTGAVLCGALLTVPLIAACHSDADRDTSFSDAASSAAVPADVNEDIQPTIHISFAADQSEKTIGNLLSDMMVWSFHGDLTSAVLDQSPTYFRDQLPFVENIQFLCATGGNAQRDLFQNSHDRSTLTDYKFDDLLLACENLLNQGVKPMIKLGNVPLKFCVKPNMDTDMGVNISPPDDYDAYYAYLRAAVAALAKKFGTEELHTWKWGVYNEFDNMDWFLAGSPEETTQAFIRLYDLSVAAVEDVLGVGQADIGLHALMNRPGYSDYKTVLRHCATGTNTRTGRQGTTIKHLSFSYYITVKGSGYPYGWAVGMAREMRQSLDEVGLTDVRLGMDEGKVFDGFDGLQADGRVLGRSYQGPLDFSLFKECLESDIQWSCMWGYSTGGMWDGLPIVSRHTADLFYKMVGSHYLSSKVAGSSPTGGQFVDAIAGIDWDKNKLYIALYNFTPDGEHPIGSDPVEIRISGLNGLDGQKRVIKTLLDDNHGNFFDDWLRDVEASGIDTGGSSWSLDGPFLDWTFRDRPQLLPLFVKNRASYAEKAALHPEEYTVDVEESTLSIRVRLVRSGVAFFEVDL